MRKQYYKEVHIELLKSELRRIFSDVLDVKHKVRQISKDIAKLENVFDSKECIFYKQESEKGTK